MHILAILLMRVYKHKSFHEKYNVFYSVQRVPNKTVLGYVNNFIGK